MTLEKLASRYVRDGASRRAISVYSGDLTRIPPEHRADLLVLSAFSNDYIPTKASLIGALHRAGLSVSALASDKEHDLRKACHFWLSKPISGAASQLNIGRIACFESERESSTPEKVGSLFRGLFPFLNEDQGSTVAMSLLAAGDQREPWHVMFDAIISTAERWMSRGLAINELKLVILDDERAHLAAARLNEMAPAAVIGMPPIQQNTPAPAHDIFLSFSSIDGEAASIAKSALQQRSDVRNVFDFRNEIPHGANWQGKLDEAIATCRGVVALITPDFEKSPECQEELMQARFRHKHESRAVFFPVYWRTLDTDLKLWIKTINYADCRERNASTLASCVANLPL